MTLVIVFVAFAIGIVASLIADKRDPDADAKREERTESLASNKGEEDEEEAQPSSRS